MAILKSMGNQVCYFSKLTKHFISSFMLIISALGNQSFEHGQNAL